MSAKTSLKIVRPKYALLAGAASLVTVSILLVIKAFAYWQSGAISVMASLIDSAVDASVSIMTFLAIRYSLKPADSDHRHGHGKIEGLAALLQAAFIAAAGFFLMIEAVARFDRPADVSHHMTAILILGISTGLSVMLVLVQKFCLRHTASLAVEADRLHYLNDVVVNAAAMLVIFALMNGAPSWIDPVFGIAVVFYLALTVREIAGKGVDMLLDRELPGDAREIITRKVLSHHGVLGMHDLRTNKSGMRVFISFDIEVKGNLSLIEAHEIARDVENELLLEFPHSDIMIHVDPHGDVKDSRHHVAGVHH